MLSAIPPDCTAVGVPARIVRRAGVRVCQDLDQVHIPDPVAQELCAMRMRMEKLEKQVSLLTEENARLRAEETEK